MTEHEQKDLFTRFKQASPRTHIKYGGSGYETFQNMYLPKTDPAFSLGLFVSKSLATLQGGLIGVRSAIDTGSTFAFFVSTRLVEPPTIYRTSEAIEGRRMADRGISFLDEMKAVNVNVLIVEDNLINQKVLKRQLQKFGWTVSVAGDGQEALNWLKESVYWQGGRETGREDDANLAIHDTAPTEPQRELDIILLDVEMPVM
jgi:hypothetical protein